MTRKNSTRKEWIVLRKKMRKKAVTKKMTNHEEETKNVDTLYKLIWGPVEPFCEYMYAR